MISAKEEPDLQIPPAVDGLLKVHKHIIDSDSDPAIARSGGTICTRLLVASSQAGSSIGKQGATVKSIQDDSHCIIRVLSEDAVIGVNGSNISYIHRASGATIAVQETKGVPDEITVDIDGSSSQVLVAQQLIQVC